ncbi:MAG: FtsK/SpoIIIE domain-containing protein [Angustibacter sp.]
MTATLETAPTAVTRRSLTWAGVLLALARVLLVAVRLSGRAVVVSARFAGWLVWELLRWCARHRRWTAWTIAAPAVLLVPLAVAVPDVRPTVALVFAAGLAPGVVCVVAAWVWPVGWERWFAGPWRRLGWWCWAWSRWTRLCRACGLSVQVRVVEKAKARTTDGLRRTETRMVPRWVDPRLRWVSARGHTLTLRVRVRVGQTTEDLAAAVPAIAAAAGGWTHRTVRVSPSTVDVCLTMADVLAAPRASTLHPYGPVTVGRAEDGHPVAIDPVAAWHVAVQGATRSGKSALCYGLLGSLAHRPDVLICGVDPSGILLGPHQGGRGAGWIATGTADPAAAVAALDGVVAEMDARIEVLHAAGLDALTAFTAARPVLVVVLEEYPGALAAARAWDEAYGRGPGDRCAPWIERAVGRLVKEGAKVGVRLLVLAQRMSANAVDTDDRSNFGTRITLRVDNADAVRMLHDGVDAAGVRQVRQFAPGLGLIETPGQPLRRWRADHTTYRQYRDRVHAGIQTTTSPAAFTAPAPASADTDSTGPSAERPARKPRAPRQPRAPRVPRQRDHQDAAPGRPAGAGEEP